MVNYLSSPILAGKRGREQGLLARPNLSLDTEGSLKFYKAMVR
jgi:hypothetical protein